MVDIPVIYGYIKIYIYNKKKNMTFFFLNTRVSVGKSINNTTIRTITSSNVAMPRSSSSAKNDSLLNETGGLSPNLNLPMSDNSQGLTTEQLLQHSNTNTNTNITNTNNNDTIPNIKYKGKKRQLNDDSSTESIDSGHLNKKIMVRKDNEESSNDSTIPNTESTENWVMDTSNIDKLIPEESIIPKEYREERVGITADHSEWVNYIQNLYLENKAQAYLMIDELAQGQEFINMYKNNYLVRVRERIPSALSRDIDYDSTFDSDSDNGNTLPDLGREINSGMLEPQLPSLSQDGSSDTDSSHADSLEFSENDYSDNGSTISDSDSNNEQTVSEFYNRLDQENDTQPANPQPENDTPLPSNPHINIESNIQPVEGNVFMHLDNPELADNPELTVHHSAASDDDVLSVSISTDSGVPERGIGLEPLNSGLKIHEATYSGLHREDAHEHGNYLINFRGNDDIEYRLLYQHLTDALDHLTTLIKNYDIVLECELILQRLRIDHQALGIDLDLDSITIFDAGNYLLHGVSAIN